MNVQLEGPNSRITGLDVARSLAMVGMVVAHYVRRDPGAGALDQIGLFVHGRAMPLFMVLGGVGITLLVRRSARPDHDLVARALLLFPMGLILQEETRYIAIILQYYAVFFVAATLLRRLSDRRLLTVAFVALAVGAYTYQAVGPKLPTYVRWEGWHSLVDGGLWWAILVNGYYPFFPAAAFLLTGMWLGRRPLSDPDFIRRLVATGAVLAICGYVIGGWIGGAVDADGVTTQDGIAVLTPALVQTLADDQGISTKTARAIVNDRYPPGPDRETDLMEFARRLRRAHPSFVWARLADPQAHSQMPAWVIGAIGGSMLAIGVSLWAAARARFEILALIGRYALTFYVFQAVVIRWTPDPSTTTISQEFGIAAMIVTVFVVFALAWRTRFSSGPLEALLRATSPPRTLGS